MDFKCTRDTFSRLLVDTDRSFGAALQALTGLGAHRGLLPTGVSIRYRFVVSLSAITGILDACAPVIFKYLVDNLVIQAFGPALIFFAVYVGQRLARRCAEIQANLSMSEIVREIRTTVIMYTYSALVSQAPGIFESGSRSAKAKVVNEALLGIQGFYRVTTFILVPLTLQLLSMVLIFACSTHSVTQVATLVLFATGCAILISSQHQAQMAARKKALVADTNAYSTQHNALDNYETIRFHAVVDFAMGRIESVLDTCSSRWQNVSVLTAKNSLIISTLSVACFLVLTGSALWDYYHGILSIGGFVLVNAYASQILLPVENITKSISELTSFIAQVSHLSTILPYPTAETHRLANRAQERSFLHPNTRPHVNSAMPGRHVYPKGYIELHDVSFAAGSRMILQNITCKFTLGSFTGVTGPSGSGKSTLLKLISGYIEPTNGFIRVVLAQGPQEDDLIADGTMRVSFVPQHVNLFDDTLVANICLGRSGEPDLLSKIIHKTNLDSLVSRLPLGLSTQIGNAGVQISGGERQRIGIARSLWVNADLILLDEPSSALDSMNEEALIDTLSGLRGKTTVIAVSHRKSLFRDADIVIQIQGGRLVHPNESSEVKT